MNESPRHTRTYERPTSSWSLSDKRAALCSISAFLLSFASLLAINSHSSFPFIAAASFAAGCYFYGCFRSLRLVHHQLLKLPSARLNSARTTLTSNSSATLPALVNWYQATIASQQQQLRSSESELEEIQAQYERLTTNLAAAVIIHDREGTATFCSPYTEVLTGYAVEDILSYPGDFLESLAVGDAKTRYHRARVMSELDEDIPVRFQILHRSGVKLWLETHMVPLTDSHGNVSATMSVSTDATVSVRYQEYIEEQNRDLSDFAYMVSHDLKAPIFTIKGMTSALTEDFGDKLGADGSELLRFITDAAVRLERLVASVIEYSSISMNTAPETDIDLNELLLTVVQDLQQQITEADANVSIDSDLPTISAPQVRVYQVFSNLVSNALKYRDTSRKAQITIRCSAHGSDGLTIAVQDNGLGIPPGKQHDIFRPYQRAHPDVAEGSGIGLACVKKIVDRLGGNVTVRSKEGSGSTFLVTFPIAEIKPQAIPESLARSYRLEERVE